MKRQSFSLILAAALLLGLPACGQTDRPPAEPDSSEVQEPLSPPVPEHEPEPEVPTAVNPLTGLPMEAEEVSRRPVAIILNNMKKAQPQLGVSQADILYEVPAEGGITRMLGVYQSLEGIGDLGSVRSARPYFMELALGHDALFVHAGGSPAAYSNMKPWGMDHMDGVNGGNDEKIFWRDPDRRRNKGYEHSLLTSGENISSYLVERGFRLEHDGSYDAGLMFQEDGTPAGGTAAEHITLKFSQYKTGTFNYDASSGRYLVEQYGGPHMDGATQTQVSAVNVLVLETSIYVISGDTDGRLSVDLTGSGEGTFFCGGKAVPIQWKKSDRNHPLSYTREDGTPLALGQGNSYVCIISPKTSTLSYE